MINIGLHHFYKHTKPEERDLDFKKTILEANLDRLVYLGGVLGVLFSLPQLKNVWIDKNVAGLSLITWLSFLAGTLFWLLYGFVHREKPMIFINLAFSIVNLFIVIGIITYR